MRKNHVAIILDRSASMSSIKHEAIGSFNDQLRVIKENTLDLESYITLVTFSTFVDTPVYQFAPAQDIPELTETNYRPSGGTAMLDAVSRTIELLKKAPGANDDNTNFLVVVISDGEENSSKTSYESVAENISGLEKTGKWTFVYLGANQDLAKVNSKMKIQRGRSQSFTSTPDGVRSVSVCHSAALDTYLTNVSMGTHSPISNFYDNSVTANNDTKIDISPNINLTSSQIDITPSET